MVELVNTIFSRLGELAPLPPARGGVHTMAASRIPSPLSVDLGDLAADETSSAGATAANSIENGTAGGGNGGDRAVFGEGTTEFSPSRSFDDTAAAMSTPSTVTGPLPQHAGGGPVADARAAAAASPGGHPVDVSSPAAGGHHDPGGAAAAAAEGTGTRAAGASRPLAPGCSAAPVLAGAHAQSHPQCLSRIPLAW